MQRFRWAMKASTRDGAERRRESGRRGAFRDGGDEEEEDEEPTFGGGTEDGMGAPDGRSATGTAGASVAATSAADIVAAAATAVWGERRVLLVFVGRSEALGELSESRY